MFGVEVRIVDFFPLLFLFLFCVIRGNGMISDGDMTLDLVTKSPETVWTASAVGLLGGLGRSKMMSPLSVSSQLSSKAGEGVFCLSLDVNGCGLTQRGGAMVS